MISARSHRAADACAPTVLMAELHQLRLRLEEAYATIEALRSDRSGLEDDLQRIKRAASMDALTGLWNRRFLLDSLEVSSSFALRQGLPLSLALLDIDHFKAVNDARGHAAGDAVLREIAAILQECARGHDVVARYGGEEFAILLLGTDRQGSTTMAERTRRALESRSGTAAGGTASFGVATISAWDDDPGAAAARLIESADAALYHSKRQGRNRVTHADELPRPGAVAASPTVG